jgi:hypothetical protein
MLASDQQTADQLGGGSTRPEASKVLVRDGACKIGGLSVQLVVSDGPLKRANEMVGSLT